MSIKSKLLAASVCTALVVPFSSSLARDGDEGERFAESQYRHDVMEHFSYGIKKIQQNMQGNVQHPDHYAPIAAIMAQTATMTKAAFVKDTRGMSGRTEAKDEIWENWGDFAERMDAMETDMAAFAEAAGSGDASQIQPAFRKAVSHCKSCHDEYKTD